MFSMLFKPAAGMILLLLLFSSCETIDALMEGDFREEQPAASQTIEKKKENTSTLAQPFPDKINTVQKENEKAPPDIEKQLSAEEHVYKARLLLQRGILDGGLDEIDLAIRLKPNYADAYTLRGEVMEYKKDKKEAIRNYGRAIELDPKKGPYVERAKLLVEENDLDGAISDYSKSIKNGQDLLLCYIERGVLYNLKTQSDLAIKDFNEALKIEPDTQGGIYYYRGNSYLDSNRFEEAIRDYTKAISLNKTLYGAVTNRGIAYLKMKSYDKALVDFNTVVQLLPEEASSYNNRCYLLHEMKKDKEALLDCEKSLKLNPESGNAWESRGTIRIALGNKKEGCGDYRKASSLGYDDPEFIKEFKLHCGGR